MKYVLGIFSALKLYFLHLQYLWHHEYYHRSYKDHEKNILILLKFRNTLMIILNICRPLNSMNSLLMRLESSKFTAEALGFNNSSPFLETGSWHY
jgi:hypothetical protein